MDTGTGVAGDSELAVVQAVTQNGSRGTRAGVCTCVLSELVRDMNNVWFTLCVGDIRTDEEGGRSFDATFTRLSQLSTDDIENIEKYRNVLHKLLDSAINHIEQDVSGKLAKKGR